MSANSSQPKESTTNEEAHMRKVALYYSIGFSLLSAIAGVILYLMTRSLEAMIFFQVPAWIFLYRILCYLFPTHEGQHPILALLRIFGQQHPLPK